MRILFFFLGGFFALSLQAQTMGSLQGKVIDEARQEALLFAEVLLLKDSIKVQKTSSDMDGNYNFSTIEAGRYDVLVSYIGFASLKVKGVMIKAGQTPKIDLVFPKKASASGQDLDEVIVTAYKVPLIEQDNTTGGQTLSAEDIRNMPTRNVTMLRGTTAGINQRDEGEVLRSTRSRYKKNDIYLDGYRLQGQPQVDLPTRKELDREDYKKNAENAFITVADEALSTFSIDVDRASYSNVRRFINNGQLPATGSVRIEEMINYFDYKYQGPQDDTPFAIHPELSTCPWNKNAQLLRVALQGKKMDLSKASNSNLVFLLDVSGSMNSANKLPLLKSSLKLLVNNLRPEDRVAIVVYAGAAGLVLPSTPASQKNKIIDALDKLEAGGSTAGGAGIELAYKVAKDNFIKNGNNRVLLATDGDFNVGVSSHAGLEELIEEKRKDDVFLTVLGFGTGNYQDSRAELLADKGNGNYSYIDNIREAQKTLVKEIGGTLFTIAKDVKIQIEFNPTQVAAYRLIGYENRLLNKEDFNDDKKDAGELGAGHTVTALYEIILKKDAKAAGITSNVDASRYQQNTQSNGQHAKEWMNIKLRYKSPKERKSKLIEYSLTGKNLKDFDKVSTNTQFATAVAGFGMLLTDSKFKGDLDYKKVIQWAKRNKGKDDDGYRAEFIRLVETVDLMQ